MIRLILIGNGFDLAHNLPTSYEDFMESLKDRFIQEDLINNRYEYKVVGNKCENTNHYHCDYKGKQDPWLALSFVNKSRKLVPNNCSGSRSIYFASLFNKYDKTGKWSDLEQHYFNLLSKYSDNIDQVKIINEEFEYLKNLLHDYLLKLDNINHEKLVLRSPIYKMLKEDCLNPKTDKVYFVTFNYTNLLDTIFYKLTRSFKDSLPLDPIYIHGELESNNNPIIFGYGDDNSEQYLDLQNKLENNLLINFKTFQYLRTSNYQTVLGLLEDVNTDISVQIIGHSCGVTDKALLRTIFQHNRVKDIESVYHDSESNYFQNLYNISRIFDDSSLMREKVKPLSKTRKI